MAGQPQEDVLQRRTLDPQVVGHDAVLDERRRDQGQDRAAAVDLDVLAVAAATAFTWSTFPQEAQVGRPEC